MRGFLERSGAGRFPVRAAGPAARERVRIRAGLSAVVAGCLLALPLRAGAAGDSRWLLFFEGGAELFDTSGFAVFEPGLEYRDRDLTVALGSPLRIGRVETGGVSHVSLRRADVDELSDLGAVLRLVSWGDEGEPFRLVAGSVPVFTLGSGGVVGGLRPSVDPDHPRAGAFAHLDVGPLLFEALASDLLSPRVFAGRVGLAVGERLLLGATGAVEPEPVPEGSAVAVAAADLSWVAVRAESWALAPYAEAAGLVDGGAGLHLGLAADFRAGPGGDARLGLRAEWRALGRGYLPRYFDEFHEVERWAYPRADAPPKHEWARQAPAGQGWAAELRLELPRGFGATAAIEGRTDGPWHALVGADLRAVPGWSFGLLVARRGADEAGGLADLGEHGGETWAMAETRVDLGGALYAFGTLATGYRVPRDETSPREFAAVSLGLGAAVVP